jgi:DNA-binding MarR family transcriptional regulator
VREQPTPRRARSQTPSLVYVIGRVDQGVRREMRKRLRDWDLSVPDYTVLSILRAGPGLSNAQLSRRSMITPPSMLEVLASLERRGLVVRHVDPDHGRILRAELTPAGARTLDAAEPAIAAMQEEMLADVPDAQREVVRAGLISVMDRLSAGLGGDAAP